MEKEEKRKSCENTVSIFPPISPLPQENIGCKKSLAHYFPTPIIPVNYIFLKTCIEHRPG